MCGRQQGVLFAVDDQQWQCQFAQLAIITDRVGQAVRLRPTPGHTPGHVSVEIAAPRGATPESVAGGGAITGDLMHSPLQVVAPDLSSSVDVDGALSAQSRRAFLEDAADSRRLVLGTHFPLPSAGHVLRSGDGFLWRSLLG